jgi:drug/metabolite transporter (DMT)-like permease
VVVQIAQVLMTKAYQQGPSHKMSMLTYLGLIYGLVADLFWFEKPVSSGALIGVFCILSAVPISLYVKNTSLDSR